LNVSSYNPLSGETPDVEKLDAAFESTMDRYKITYRSRNAYTNLTIQFPDGVRDVQAQVVDQEFGVMHRIRLAHGEWFTPYDEQRMAPALIVNEVFWKLLGSPALSSHPTVTIPGTQPTTAVITAVTPSAQYEDYPSAYILTTAFDAVASDEQKAQTYPNYEAWAPLDMADELTTLIQRDVAGALGTDWQTDVVRNDYLAYSDEDPLLFIKLLVTGVAILILLLGALGLVNISMVTVRQRIREIGIRRSFGATAGRVFFAVMMESVVATVVAGIAGVAIAVLAVKNPWVTSFVAQGVQDVPAFPIEAALIGLASATFVGALAGLLPALVAVRVKVIDAIRY
jgi:putative ABC transport system permease protein